MAVAGMMMALPVLAAAPRAAGAAGAAHAPLAILQLNVSNEAGQPASNADVEVFNTDNATLGQNDVFIVGGVGRIAVPTGHYSAFAFFDDTAHGSKQVTAVRVVTITDFTVRAAPRVTTVSVDERSASKKISVAVPRPACEDLLSVTFYRQAAAGNYADAGLSAFPGVPLYVSPAPAARIGRLHYVVQWGAMAPGTHPAYRYDVAFAADRVPADEAFKVLASQVATVQQHFSADPGGVPPGGQLFNGPVDPVTALGVPTTFGVNKISMAAGQNGEAMPGNLTDYLGTADGARWAEMVGTGFGTILSADVHTFRAGHTYSVSWAHGPLAPGFGQHAGPQPCSACLAGRTLSLGLSPQGDSEPDHVTLEGGLFQPPALPARYQFRLYRDGVPLAGSGQQPGLIVSDVRDSSATFRAVLDVDMSAQPAMTQSTRTETDLTIRYNPADAARLPAADSCAGRTARNPCRILPALTLGYQLATDEYDRSHSAVQTMGLRVDHISYDGAGSRARIRAVTVWVSFDHGVTWRPVTVRGSSGRYTASWANPASARGTDPAIRVTASDTLGGAITQTIFNAYTIAATGTAGPGPQRARTLPAWPVRPGSVRDACPKAAPGQFGCFAKVRTDIHGGFGVRGPAAVAAGHPAAAALPAGYGPADLRSAYQLPVSGGRGQTVAIVDAGDDPIAEADLAVYRATYGLPPCTTANGCFRKVNQQGSARPLPPDQGWGTEISLDLDMVSAVCPSCHIVLVEANTPTFGDAAAAENTASRLGANVVSNSYGATEQNGMQPYEAAYSHPGRAIVASSDDYGYGIPVFPAVLRSVIAVGGTTLRRAAGTRDWSETAWSYAGSGCSAWIPKPAWQRDPLCPGRMVADVAAVADPRTGVAIYDTHDGLGWTEGGGTSTSAPLIAGVIALAGNAAELPDASYLYAHAHALDDVITGSNATRTQQCGQDYLCTAVPGYDGPTGRGTPHGLRAF